MFYKQKLLGIIFCIRFLDNLNILNANLFKYLITNLLILTFVAICGEYNK